MASTINVSSLTLNPKEVQDFGQIILEMTFGRPELRAMHRIYSGVTMKEQIVLASKLGLSGLKANGCERQSSGAKANLTQKYWEPVGIEDTFVNCQADVNSLFKPYYDKIRDYKQMYNIDASDEEAFIGNLVSEAMNETIYRAIWFADTDVAASDAGTAGLKDAANVPAFNYFDGIWKQIFTGVTGGTIDRVSLSFATPGAPTAAEAYKAIFDVYKQADSRIVNSVDSKFYVSGKIFLALVEYMQTESVNFTLDYTMNGFASVKFLGHDVINMGPIWDENIAYFEEDSTSHDAYLPDRIVFTIPDNIPVGTLNEDDMTTLESWYNIDTRENKVAYGFSLDAKVLDDKLITVAY